MSQGQGSTTEHNRMVSDREDRKQTAKPIDVSHSQGSTTENIRQIANRED